MPWVAFLCHSTSVRVQLAQTINLKQENGALLDEKEIYVLECLQIYGSLLSA